MSLFDTIRHTCPACGADFPIQVKPCNVRGWPQTFDLVDTPDAVLKRASYSPERCACGCILMIVQEPPIDGWSLRIAKDYSIEDLPKQIEFKIATRR